MWHHHIDRTLVLPGGATYQFHQGWPSGSPATTIVESLASLLVTFVGARTVAPHEWSLVEAGFATGDDLELHSPREFSTWWPEVKKWITRTTGYVYGEDQMYAPYERAEILGMTFDGVCVSRTETRLVSGVVFPTTRNVNPFETAVNVQYKLALAGVDCDVATYSSDVRTHLVERMAKGEKPRARAAKWLREKFHEAVAVLHTAYHTAKATAELMTPSVALRSAGALVSTLPPCWIRMFGASRAFRGGRQRIPNVKAPLRLASIFESDDSSLLFAPKEQAKTLLNYSAYERKRQPVWR